jgi:hypothetical protein
MDSVRQACSARGIAVDAAGADVGRVTDNPGELLRNYDVVFAKARCAMEALAVGCAVVLCDRSGLGPMVSSGNFDEVRRLNFGLRTLRAPVSPETVAARLADYDPSDAARVSTRIRTEARIEDAVGQLLELFDQVLEDWNGRARSSLEEELRGASLYLQRITAEPPPRVAAGALLKSTYFVLARIPLVRWLMPSPQTALRLYQRIRRS